MGTGRLPSAYLILEYNYRGRSDLFGNYLAQPAFGNHHEFNLWCSERNRWPLIDGLGLGCSGTSPPG